MRRTYCCLTLVALFAFGLCVRAQEVVVDFCDPNACPAPDPECCTNDTLEVIFGDDLDNSVFEFDPFVAGMRIDTQIVVNTMNAQIQGWSYGVKNDDQFTDLIEDSVTTAGTVVDEVFNGGFNNTAAAPGGGGWTSAVVLSFVAEVEIPPGQRNNIGKASYNLTADPGRGGTLIEIVADEVRPNPNSPPVAINITIAGNAKTPLQITQGLIRAGGGLPPEDNCTDGIDNDEDGQTDCDDADCDADPACQPEDNCNDGVDNDNDGLIDCADPDCAGTPDCPVDCPDYAFYFGGAASVQAVDAGDAATLAIGQRNADSAFAISLGVSTTAQGGTTSFEFSDQLGTSPQTLVELIITTEENDMVVTNVPLTPNTATANRAPVNVVRGAATQAFEPTDFFQVELQPEVGGPGFFVGYVSDLANDVNTIPATPAAGCPVNEVLRIEFTGDVFSNFSRGDADGNGKINVSDAVVIIQVAANNVMEPFDCDEARDADNDGDVDVADALPVLAWVFQRGARLDAPFLACGPDNDGDAVSCNDSDASAFCNP